MFWNAVAIKIAAAIFTEQRTGRCILHLLTNEVLILRNPLCTVHIYDLC
jgi:hypothetical protein